ncbi:unnamed protein product [Rotaria magnacalcarata]|uniref:Flagellin n=1 Tax=Rotaria magnacalcarata TaxID=392030 RepID=A0A819QYG2_9BILA|nr:unnamed protein product [Rotaria magnacalcarata]
MSGITLKNPVINSVPIAINLGRKNIDVSGTSLSTGLKTNNDVVSSFLGRNLNDRSKILNQFYKNVGYGLNIAQTAQEGLNYIARTLIEMQGIINSVGGSQTAIRSLNDIFQQKLLQIEQQTNSVKFDSVKLLTGEFGSDPTIKSKYNTKIVDVRKTGIGSGTLFEGAGTRAVKIIDVQNIANIKAGDTITLHDVNFKIVQNKGLITSESDILIGKSEEQTVSNIATALKNHSSEIMRLYDITTYNKQVIVRQRSCSTTNIPLHHNPTIGSNLTIAGVVFEFVANGTAGNDPTKVEIKNNRKDKECSDVGLKIASIFNKDILGLKVNFVPGDLDDDIFRISQKTTYAYEMKFLQASVAGDIIRYKTPNGVIENYNLTNQTIYDFTRRACEYFLYHPNIGVNIGGLVHQENCSISYNFRKRIVSIYTNYNMNLQYIPANPADPRMIISPAPISMADVSVIKPAVNVIAQATSGAVAGDELASILYRQAKGDVPLPTIPVDGDITTVLHVDIAASTGETFSINTKDLNSDITTLQHTIDTLAKPIENLLSSTSFAQIRDLEIDNSSKEIMDDNGKVIGNLDGMTVSLNSTDFSNKQFEDFVIKPDPDILGKTLFIATINGQKFVCRVRDSELKEGKSLTFNGNNGDTLTINIGKGRINFLSDPKNYKFIASAMKKSLMKIGSGVDVKTGFDLDNVSKLVIADVSATKLYRNNQNEYVPKLDLLTMESAKVAQEVITNALNLVYLTRAKLQGQGDNLDRYANVLGSTIGITKDASSSYLDTDLIEASNAFVAALKSILVAVFTLQAGAKVADASLEIIKSASV